jgi:hypothetical protein
MSNITVFNPAQAPEFARKVGLSDMAKVLAGGSDAGKRVSIKGGVFRLMDSGKEVASIDERHLNIVLVKAAPKVSRVFYMKRYASETVSAPDCWSADGVKPSPEAANPQAASCDDCPKNIAGSGQGNMRACRFQQRLAVVLENDMSGDVLQLTLPSKSIFGKADGDNRPLQAYARWLVAQGINPEAVVTQMRFDTTSESPKLFFKAVRWLSDEEYEIIEQQSTSDAAVKAITMTVAKMDGVQDAPAVLEGKPPAKVKAKVEESEEGSDVEEPVVRKEVAKKPVVESKPSLAAMVSDWDDE